MSKATTRWEKTRAFVRTLPNVNANKLALFENVCGEIDLDEEELGAALHVSKFKVGDKDKRLALRALELTKIVEAIVANRIALKKSEYKSKAKQLRDAHKDDSDIALRQSIVTGINNLPALAQANAYRVYVEDFQQGQIDKVGIDLPLPGQAAVKQQAHENTYIPRLPNMINVGPSVKMSGAGTWGVLPYLGEGNQDFVVFTDDGVRAMWTNDISYCVPVACLYGALPAYTAMTFTHLPGGNVTKCNWDWMFLTNMPHNKQFNYGLPSKVVVAYNPHSLDASTLECLDILSKKVPAQNIVVYGFTTGHDFGIDKFGYFGMLEAKPTKYDRHSKKPGRL